MVTVRDLLRVKGDQVFTITPNTSVIEALRLLTEKDIGALLVEEGQKIVGIISERDFVRMIAETGRCPLDAFVNDIMTTEVITVHPDQTIQQCMTIMTQERIRHLPVIDEERLIGLVSIGDVVKSIITSHESTIDQLENFISGRGYGH